MNGIVVDQPLISLTLDGRETWEMRSQRTSVRAPVSFTAKGGTVVALADLSDVVGRLDARERGEHQDNHCTPSDSDEIRAKCHIALNRKCVRWLRIPVACRQVRESFVGVRFEPDVVRRAQANLEWADGARLAHERGDIAQILSPRCVPLPQVVGPRDASDSVLEQQVACPKDDSFFSPHLQRARNLPIGAQREKQSVAGYRDALHARRVSAITYWRRPDKNSHLGIVAGVTWAMPQRLPIS